MGKNKPEIEVEIEQNGHKVELEIEEEGGTSAAEVERDDGSDEPEDLADASKRRSGAGFLLGLVIGAAAGAVAAIAFSPSEEEQQGESAPFGGNGGSTAAEGEDRARSLLGQVRTRLADARDEARDAAREAEARTRARYAELTGDKS